KRPNSPPRLLSTRKRTTDFMPTTARPTRSRPQTTAGGGCRRGSRNTGVPDPHGWRASNRATNGPAGPRTTSARRDKGPAGPQRLPSVDFQDELPVTDLCHKQLSESALVHHDLQRKSRCAAFK